MEALIAVISRVDNVAVLVLLIVTAGIGYLYVTERRESREDRRAWMELMDRNTEALNGLRNAISAMTGKPL